MRTTKVLQRKESVSDAIVLDGDTCTSCQAKVGNDTAAEHPLLKVHSLWLFLLDAARYGDIKEY